MPKPKKRRLMVVATLALIVILSFVTPFSGLLLTDHGSVATAAEDAVENNPRSDYWRQVRQSNVGSTTVGGEEAGVLINDGGQNWRRIRNGWVANTTPWLLLLVVVAITLYHLLHGQNKVSEPLSGRKVLRWKVYERVLHFSVASLFILLAITGLSLLFGRALLIPVIGKEAFSAYAAIAKDIHNYIGPIFSVCIAILIVLWMKHNFFKDYDWAWLKSWGGLIGGDSAHSHAGRMNAGEKLWFWLISTVGVAVCLSGLVLDFPNFQQGREAMQIANVIHALLSIAWIAVALGHIYIGTAGTEGALEGMTTGYVSEEWARQHHVLWLEETKQAEASPVSSAATVPAAGGETDVVGKTT